MARPQQGGSCSRLMRIVSQAERGDSFWIVMGKPRMPYRGQQPGGRRRGKSPRAWVLLQGTLGSWRGLSRQPLLTQVPARPGHRS